MKVCNSIFEKIEIDDSGETYFCCEGRVARFSIGNIFKQSFDEVWNAPIAVKMREEALAGKYPYCNSKICHKLVNNVDEHFCEQQEHFQPIMQKGPTQISFPIDQDCSAKCIFCRDEIRIASEKELNDLRHKLHNIYLPMCKDVEYLTVNNLGDAFSSRFSREFIQTISQNYPHIKFVLMTNGISATKELIDSLGLPGKIKEFDISINAINEKTHEKIFRIKGFKQLLKNLKYIAELKSQNKIEFLNFNFVVCKYNWKEMKAFIAFAKRHNAKINFWEVRNYSDVPLENNYENMTIHREDDKEFNKFRRILCDKIFDDEDVVISPVIKKIREDALNEYKSTFLYKISHFLN